MTYYDKLRAFCESLEMENIEMLMTKKSEFFKALEETMTKRIKEKEGKKYMTATELKHISKEEAMNFIRKRLSNKSGIIPSTTKEEKDIKYHRRFNMSGYDNPLTGICTVWNLSILNEFADLGIYDYTSYLFLDFYKGQGILYLQYFHDDENLEVDLGGLGTTEIVYAIFKLTIFSGMEKRRR